jgi:L-threonylcarbamoyladenylate synthase
LLKAGGLVAIPTETVYGLAANALDQEAVLQIFKTKNRPAFNPLIVHVNDISEFERYVVSVPKEIYRLAELFSPGPLTFVLPKKSVIPDIVTGGGETVALRIPKHPVALALLQNSGLPLAAPSANPFGYISPVTAAHVKESLEGKIPYILEGGACSIGVESTVVMMRGETLVVLRKGGIGLEELREVVSDVRLEVNLSSDPKSPGQLKSHYAPRVPFLLGDLPALLHEHAGKPIAVLSFEKSYAGADIVANEVLSVSGDLTEAARNLFNAMRRLDRTDVQVILAERVPDQGLGMAINDRLERAAAIT